MDEKNEIKVPLLLNQKDAAAYLGVSRVHFIHMENSKRLGPESVYLGRCKLYSTDELRAWVKAGCPRREDWRLKK